MVDFAVRRGSAQFAPAGQEPVDQFLAEGRGSMWVWDAIGDDRILPAVQRDAAEPCGQWLPAGSLDAGFQACLPKPFTPDKLLATILAVLND